MHCHLAEGLLKSSEVRMEEISKMLADIFKDPLVDCLCKVNASMLLASKSTADRTRKNIIVARSLSIEICRDYWNEGSFSTSEHLYYSCNSSKKGQSGRMSQLFTEFSQHISLNIG